MPPAMKRPLALALALALAAPATAAGFDPFGVAEKLDPFGATGRTARTQASAMLDSADVANPCQFGPVGTPLGLVEVVERALCNNPRTRQAWANAKVQAALLGVRESAYLPSISAGLTYGKQKSSTSYSAPYTGLDSESEPTIRSGSLKMSWVLTDFGLRSANVDQARALLEAANASHDATLQAAFVAAAQAYFDTLTAQATLDAKREAEKAAKESQQATTAKYKAGVGGLTDQLQASTAYSQARLETVVAEGDLKNMLGSLAIAMGLDVHTRLELAKPAEALPDTAFVKPVEELIEDARAHHPALAAAQAEVKAAEANVSAVRAEGRPTVALASELSRSDQLGQPPAVTYPNADISTTNASIGIQLNVPLFEGFGRGYKVRSAQGQVEAKQAEYAQVEQQVLMEVWKNYQSLTAEGEGLKAAADLVKNARESFNVARGRYKSGVGNIVELINVQSALAKAEQQRIKTVSNWHNARLKLAASVGKIGLWAITPGPSGK